MFRAFAHLQRHPSSGIFYFRIAIPAHLRDTLGRREVKRSLGTGLRSEATVVAHRLYAETMELFTRLEKKRMAPAPKQPKPVPAADILAALDSMPVSPDGSLQKITVTIAGNKVVIEGDNRDEEVKAAADLLRLAPVTAIPAAAPKGRPKKETSVTLSTMVKAYFDEVKATGTQTEKTIEENRAIFQLLQEVTKNPTAETIGIKAAIDFKAVLLRLPPNRDKKYPGKSVSEILRMRPAETMSNSNVNKYLRRCGALFTWGKRHGYCHDNPFTGLAIRRDRLPHQQRERFTIEDLQRLFDPAHLRRDARKSYMFWLPWLGLYTGAWLEELCQLHLDDIRQVDGVWCLDINAKDEKRLRTLSSERLVPLHPRLVELGLLDHVEMLRKRGEQRLFPELGHRRDGYGQTASKWFARYRERLGITKPFHSLRHTVIDSLKQSGVEYKLVAALAGHSDESMTFGRYADSYRPDVLLPVVKMLDFPINAMSNY
ncbi:site-specific integrase [Desulfobulbus elongatus]|uniref:site-specific integrase n=1 Tax=Desulfobulbus elongatus TaxID=53332 RepID=UPI0004800551|nr:site-specific integrase [Desulfobulbus elongatus]